MKKSDKSKTYPTQNDEKLLFPRPLRESGLRAEKTIDCHANNDEKLLPPHPLRERVIFVNERSEFTKMGVGSDDDMHSQASDGFAILRSAQNDRKKAAFTLAEVLITLGVIGVVAAMTMPTVIKNYKKKVVETKVKKFYTVMSQATNRSIAENGPMENWDGFSSYKNPTETQAWFDKYYKPYLKIVKEYTQNGVLYVVFADGSIASFSNWAGSNPDIDKDTGKDNNHVGDNFNGLVHIAYRIDEKAINNAQDCKNRFVFLLYNKVDKKYYFQPYSWGISARAIDRASLISKIQGEKQYCTLLLMHDSWVIKDDFPGW